MNVDLYDILGIEADASQAEVKRAYRRMALKFHPDQNPGDKRSEERFKEVTHAYEVLSDPQKRRAYDRLQRRNRHSPGQTPSFDNFGDLFEVLNSVISAGFSGLGRSASTRRGKNIRAGLTVTLEEAMTGVRRDVTVPRSRECSRCGASGAEPGSKLTRCQECKGKGQVRLQQGFFSLMRECKNCLGRGRVVETPCTRCGGEGEIEGTELMPIDVPAGVRDGQTLRWSGKGAPGRGGGTSGDLLIDVTVEDHPVFSRQGQDIHLAFPISFTQASLGAKVEVPTLDGQVLMKIPPGTQSGRVFRLRAKGLPAVGDRPHGDQYVRLEIKSPQSLNKRQEELRDQFESKQDQRSRRDKGIWSRVRDFFE